jgi:fluoroacetyl-CoA thioesterase
MGDDGPSAGAVEERWEMAIEIGIENEARYEVTDDMAPGHLPAKVLSTPNMIGMIEGTCLFAVQPHLEEGQATVGVHVCVSHEGAAASGQEILIKARLKEIEKRRLTFDTEVSVDGRIISRGTHQRAIIDTKRFG